MPASLSDCSSCAVVFGFLRLRFAVLSELSVSTNDADCEVSDFTGRFLGGFFLLWLSSEVSAVSLSDSCSVSVSGDVSFSDFCSVSAAGSVSLSVCCSFSSAVVVSFTGVLCALSCVSASAADFCSVSFTAAVSACFDVLSSAAFVFSTVASDVLLVLSDALCELPELDFLLRFDDLLPVLPDDFADEVFDPFDELCSLLPDDAILSPPLDSRLCELLSELLFLRFFFVPDDELSELLPDAVSVSVSAVLLSDLDRCFFLPFTPASLLTEPSLPLSDVSSVDCVSDFDALSFLELSALDEESCPASCEETLTELSLLLSDVLPEVLEQPEAIIHIASISAAALILFSFIVITLFH